MHVEDSTCASPAEAGTDAVRNRAIERSEDIRSRLQRVSALQAELRKRMDRLERERRDYERMVRAK